MKKDAYYFPHDANAQDDPKCMLLIDQLGMAGFGIFWALIEKLRSEKDFKLPLNIIGSLSKRWRTTKEKVDAVIHNYNLFIIESETHFYSQRLSNSMKDKSEKARQSANYRWENANALRPHTNRNANGMRNDANKGEEKKGEESITHAQGKKDFLVYDAEKELLENLIQFEKICMATGTKDTKAKKELHAYHLWLTKNEKYPIGRYAVFAGFESWILTGKRFRNLEEETVTAPPLKRVNQ